MTEVRDFSEKLIGNIEQVIIGKQEAIKLMVVNLLSEGHLLIEDVPGVGKTMLARSLARSLGLSFHRIQFTPDMLPSDVTGVSIFNQVSREFEFRPGPLFAQVLLADEINRATPKTQAALLEAMEEAHVTIDGFSHELPDPFVVLATQNPIEYEGTFPLPEAQLDRFLMRIRLGYPDFDSEVEVLNSQQHRHPFESITKVVDVIEVKRMQDMIKNVFVADPVRDYIVSLTRETRQHKDAYLGASTRGSLALFRAGQAMAAMEGREYVLPDDIKVLAVPCLAHRVILGPSARLGEVNTEEIVTEVIESVAVPTQKLTPAAG
ncbi:MAG: MoxR family ATPase [Anaerolineae bacterium]|nr:MoxR family ATPase [Anaerolineae bacterium]